MTRQWHYKAEWLNKSHLQKQLTPEEFPQDEILAELFKDFDYFLSKQSDDPARVQHWMDAKMVTQKEIDLMIAYAVEHGGQIWRYSDMGILCGSSGYCVVVGDEIKEVWAIWRS